MTRVEAHRNQDLHEEDRRWVNEIAGPVPHELARMVFDYAVVRVRGSGRPPIRVLVAEGLTAQSFQRDGVLCLRRNGSPVAASIKCIRDEIYVGQSLLGRPMEVGTSIGWRMPDGYFWRMRNDGWGASASVMLEGFEPTTSSALKPAFSKCVGASRPRYRSPASSPSALVTTETHVYIAGLAERFVMCVHRTTKATSFLDGPGMGLLRPVALGLWVVDFELLVYFTCVDARVDAPTKTTFLAAYTLSGRLKRIVYQSRDSIYDLLVVDGFVLAILGPGRSIVRL